MPCDHNVGYIGVAVLIAERHLCMPTQHDSGLSWLAKLVMCNASALQVQLFDLFWALACAVGIEISLQAVQR